MVKCPVCDGAIDVDEEDVDEGDTISCDECGADLRVVGTDPLELESAEDLEEEDEDEDDFLEDEEEEPTRTGSSCASSLKRPYFRAASPFREELILGQENSVCTGGPPGRWRRLGGAGTGQEEG